MSAGAEAGVAARTAPAIGYSFAIPYPGTVWAPSKTAARFNRSALDRPGVPCISSCARGITAHIASPPSGRCPLPAHPKSNLISRGNFSLQVLEHRQMHLDHRAGQDSDVFVIVSGQNRIQESLLDVQQLLVTDDLTLNIGDVKELA